MKFQKPGTVVAVEWYDAESIDSWSDLEERLEQHKSAGPCKTFGVVLEHNEKVIIVARTFNETDQTLEGSFQIPSSMIKSIKKLTYPIVDITDYTEK